MEAQEEEGKKVSPLSRLESWKTKFYHPVGQPKLDPEMEALARAVQDGDMQAFKEHIASVPDVNVHIRNETLLHLVIQKGNMDMVHTLLTRGFDVNFGSSDMKQTGLHLVAELGDDALAAMLVQAGADVNAAMLHKNTPLRVACVKGHANIVSLLLRSPDLDPDLPDRTGRSPLISAVEFGHLDIVHMLLDAGCDKNKTDSLGRSPIWHAVHRRYKEILTVLIDAGTHMDVTDHRGMSPLHHAARFGFIDVIQILVEKGCDVNVRGYMGSQEGPAYTPLWEAIQSGQLKAVRMLLEGGADPNVMNVVDHYSLGNALFAMMMSNHCRLDILHTLIEGRVDVSYQNAYGYSALHFAVDKNWVEAARTLILADCRIGVDEQTWIQSYQADPTVSEQVRELCCWALCTTLAPPALMRQCRRAIISTLPASRPMNSYVDALPLPSALKQFVLYRDIEQ